MAFHSFRSSSDRSSSSLFRSRESSVGLSFNGLLVNSFLGLLAVFAADAVRRAGRALGDGAGSGPSIGASAVSSSPVPSNGVGGISSPPSLRTKASVSRSSSSSCSGVSPPWALKSSEAPLEVSSSSDAWAASPAASPPDVSSGESAAFLRETRLRFGFSSTGVSGPASPVCSLSPEGKGASGGSSPPPSAWAAGAVASSSVPASRTGAMPSVLSPAGSALSTPGAS